MHAKFFILNESGVGLVVDHDTVHIIEKNKTQKMSPPKAEEYLYLLSRSENDYRTINDLCYMLYGNGRSFPKRNLPSCNRVIRRQANRDVSLYS